MTPLQLNQILEAPDVVFANVHVPGWNGSVRLKAWTAGDRVDFDSESDELRKHVATDQYERLLPLRAVAWSMVDGDGRLIIRPVGASAIRAAAEVKSLTEVLAPYWALCNKSARAINRVYSIVCELNGIGEEAELDIEGN